MKKFTDYLEEVQSWVSEDKETIEEGDKVWKYGRLGQEYAGQVWAGVSKKPTEILIKLNEKYGLTEVGKMAYGSGGIFKLIKDEKFKNKLLSKITSESDKEKFEEAISQAKKDLTKN